MVLVTGAAGTTGSEVTRLLAAKGVRVRALVRDPEKLKRFTGASVEPVVANLEDPATLDPALKGIDKVFLVSSPAQLEDDFARSIPASTLLAVLAAVVVARAIALVRAQRSRA
jgi:uncharacterized protein YbjT (DUF2867 family)